MDLIMRCRLLWYIRSEIYQSRSKSQYVGQPHLVLMKHIFSRWNLMILGKITTLCSSMMGCPDVRPQHMGKNYNSLLVHDGSSWSTTSAHGSQDEETRPEPSRKDEFQASSSLAKPRPESTRRWIVQTRHWTSHLSVIDKVDGNRCQRRLDELGQTIRC